MAAVTSFSFSILRILLRFYTPAQCGMTIPIILCNGDVSAAAVLIQPVRDGYHGPIA